MFSDDYGWMRWRKVAMGWMKVAMDPQQAVLMTAFCKS